MAMVFCRECGKEIHDSAPICPHCGAPQNIPDSNRRVGEALKSQTVAGLLCAFLGGLGAHRFYLGKTVSGILFLLFCWTGIPGLIAFFNLFGIAFASQESWAKEYNNGIISPPVNIIVKIITLIFPVITVIGILAAIALPAYQDYTMKAKTANTVMALTSAKTTISEYAQSKDGAVIDPPTLKAIKDSIVGTPSITGIDAFTYKTYADIIADVTIGTTAGQVYLVSNDSGTNWTCLYNNLPTKLMPKSCENSDGVKRPVIEKPKIGLWTIDFANSFLDGCIQDGTSKGDLNANVTCQCLTPKMAKIFTQEQLSTPLSEEDLQTIQMERSSCSQ